MKSERFIGVFVKLLIPYQNIPILRNSNLSGAECEQIIIQFAKIKKQTKKLYGLLDSITKT